LLLARNERSRRWTVQLVLELVLRLVVLIITNHRPTVHNSHIFFLRRCMPVLLLQIFFSRSLFQVILAAGRSILRQSIWKRHSSRTTLLLHKTAWSLHYDLQLFWILELHLVLSHVENHGFAWKELETSVDDWHQRECILSSYRQ